MEKAKGEGKGRGKAGETPPRPHPPLSQIPGSAHEWCTTLSFLYVIQLSWRSKTPRAHRGLLTAPPESSPT